jgi:hypothetical protein
MSLESIVNVTIQANARGVTRKSFGIPMVVGKHDAWGERYRIYNLATALADIVTDGISATGPIYKAVRALAQANPKPEKVVIGRLVTDYDYLSELTVQATVTEGDVYSFNLRSPAGVVTEISYTAQAADTPTLVATAVAALITAVTGITSTAAVAVISNAADNSNETWQFEGLNKLQFHYEDTTIDSSLATEIAEIETLYPDWYGLILADAPSNARITAVAAYVETLEKIFGAVSYDHENLVTSSVDSIMYDLAQADYFRTYCLFSNDQNSHGAARWMGGMFALNAGSATWSYKSLSGTVVDDLTAGQIAEIESNNGNYYVEIAGLSVTREGTMASGEWIDVVRGRDWFVSQIRERIFALLANSPKIPYTDPGVSLITKEVEAAQTDGINRTFLAAEPVPFVTAPLVADVSDADKIARILPDVYFEQTLAGAIHAVKLYGVLKV